MRAHEGSNSVKLDFNDVLVMTGLGLFGSGLWWMINPAASLTAVGAAMMVIAYLRSGAA